MVSDETIVRYFEELATFACVGIFIVTPFFFFLKLRGFKPPLYYPSTKKLVDHPVIVR